MKIRVTTKDYGVYESIEPPKDIGADATKKEAELAARGDLLYMSFPTGNGKRVYIPEKVLETSIIEIFE